MMAERFAVVATNTLRESSEAYSILIGVCRSEPMSCSAALRFSCRGQYLGVLAHSSPVWLVAFLLLP